MVKLLRPVHHLGGTQHTLPTDEDSEEELQESKQTPADPKKPQQTQGAPRKPQQTTEDPSKH